ncbi:flippase [Loigolactobacillus binensis]|uniref:Flippase n=1 Tax=Loigolactobacillus binensis TaxID=2559922 RepID=A0ABW3EBE4_9LACO|nr:flippase [Loigolactobacillus binensis]
MKVVKNYLYNAGYQVFLLLVPLITTPYIARVIGPTGVGINAFTNSIIQYFVLFGSIGINMYGNREIAFYRDDPKKMTQSFWEIELLRFSAIILAELVFFAYLSWTSKYHEYLLMQSLLITAAAFDISWFFMGLEDFKTTIMRNMVVKVISIILIFTFVKTAQDLAVYILIISGSQLLGNLTLWPFLRKHLVKMNWRKLNLWPHLRPALVLFVPQIATQIYLVLNKTMLGQITGVTAAGFFDNSDKIIKMVLAVVTATGTVMLPRVAHTFAKGDNAQVQRYLYSSFDFVTAASVPMAMGLAAIAPKFAIWFFGAKFAATNTLIMLESPAILVIAWSNVLGMQYLMPTNRNRDFTVSVTVGAIVNLILNIPLITFFGAAGAAISTVISEASVTIYQLYVVRKELTLRHLFTDIWKYLIAGLAMFTVVYWLNITRPFNLVWLLIEIGAGVIIYGILIVILRAKILKQVQQLLHR